MQVARQPITDDMLIPYDKRPTHIDGVPVTLRTRALLPHPHPSQEGRLVETRGVTEVMLEGAETSIGECDICLITRPNPRSVLSHLTSHNPENGKPDYPGETIRHIIRLCVKERDAGTLRGSCERVAAILNSDDKIRPHRADVWSAEMISGLYNRYKDRYPVKTPRKSATRGNGAPRTPGITRRTPATEGSVDALIYRIEDGIAAARLELDKVEAELGKLRADVAAVVADSQVDPNLAAKAAKYDEFMRNMSIN